MTRVIVLVVGPWKDSKTNGYPYMRVTFELADEPGSYVYLNLTKNVQGQDYKWAQWVPHLKPGNVLDVTMQANNKNVNQFAPFRVVDVKPKNKEALSEEKV